MEGIIIAVLWAVCSGLVMVQYAPLCAELGPEDQLLVGAIFMVGGPFFAIVNVLEAILDTILPEGWDENG